MQVSKTTRPGYHPDGNGLYLQVISSGAKSWIFRYTRNGREHQMGLGSFSTFSLAEARERALAQRKLLADGHDPLTVRREALAQARNHAANDISFDDAAAAYSAANEAGWKSSKHADQWRTTLKTYASPVMGHLPVARVDTALVLRVIQPIWTTKSETASRLRGRIESVLDWARVQGYREGENPARWRGHLEQTLPARSKVAKAEHLPALPWRDIGTFMAELRAMAGMSALAVELIILTATRTSEVLLAQWKEFDLNLAQWTIPAGRMKAAREHVVPLSEQALRLLANMMADRQETLDAQSETEIESDLSEEYVFRGPKGQHLSNMAGLQVLKRMGRADVTVHGFRSTFRDWAGESTGHAREVIEHALAHQLADKAEAAYQRGTLLAKRKALMQDWANYCDSSSVQGP